jgi:transcription initiation factor TFIIB
MRVSEVDPADSQVEQRQSVSEAEETGCSECECSETRKHNDEIICEACGLVLSEDKLDRGPDWRAFDEQDRQEKRRVGAPTTLTMHDKGLTTEMGNISTSGMSRRKRNRLDRLEEWDSRSKYSEKGRGLKFALGEIQRMISALDIHGDIHTRSAKIFREAHDADLVQGRSYEGMATAAIYIACREHEVPRTFDEMQQVSRVDRQNIVSSYRKISSKLGIHLSPPDPIRYVKRYVSKVRRRCNLSKFEYSQLERNTRYIINKMKENKDQITRSPISIVAGGIYLAAQRRGLDITQKDVSEPCDVGSVTVRSVYQEQKDILGIAG